MIVALSKVHRGFGQNYIKNTSNTYYIKNTSNLIGYQHVLFATGN